ncbi:MAG TPA: HlyD family secretion protein [Gammaproteobacteria bacterium]|nr:HlyD family secretion protein [Gammaproteobacteria bacterium]
MSKLNNARGRLLFSVIICIAVGLCSFIIYFIFFRPYVYTDDAYVGANYVSVASQVSGVAVRVHVTNNQHVQAGDLLFEIEAAPFQIAVNKAQAQLDLMGNEVREAAAYVHQSEANVELRKSDLRDAQVSVQRIFDLVAKSVLSPQDKDDAESRLKTAEQNMLVAKSRLEDAQIRLGSMGDQNEQIRIATANLQYAKVNLSYTKIYAPFSGQVSNCTLISGQLVSAGKPQFALIEDKEFWIDANFKETQLEDIRIGQSVSIRVDMYPNKTFTGEVLSISGATGTVFSLLPPQNATGNWVKVTQRVPVRILVNPLEDDFPLRIGTSATVRVKVK